MSRIGTCTLLSYKQHFSRGFNVRLCIHTLRYVILTKDNDYDILQLQISWSYKGKYWKKSYHIQSATPLNMDVFNGLDRIRISRLRSGCGYKNTWIVFNDSRILIKENKKYVRMLAPNNTMVGKIIKRFLDAVRWYKYNIDLDTYNHLRELLSDEFRSWMLLTVMMLGE